MTPDAIINIKNSFAANPDLKELFCNEHGHCFKAGGEGLTLVTLASLDELGKESLEGDDAKTPGEMTVAELKEALTALSVEFAAKANKAELVALLTEAQGV